MQEGKGERQQKERENGGIAISCKSSTSLQSNCYKERTLGVTLPYYTY